MGSRPTIAALILLSLVGCARTEVVETSRPNECYIALAQIDRQWLAPVPPLAERSGDAIGDLLQDYADVAALGGQCRVRHQSLIDYLQPLVDKAKEQ